MLKPVYGYFLKAFLLLSLTLNIPSANSLTSITSRRGKAPAQQYAHLPSGSEYKEFIPLDAAQGGGKPPPELLTLAPSENFREYIILPESAPPGTRGALNTSDEISRRLPLLRQ